MPKGMGSNKKGAVGGGKVGPIRTPFNDRVMTKGATGKK